MGLSRLQERTVPLCMRVRDVEVERGMWGERELQTGGPGADVCTRAHTRACVCECAVSELKCVCVISSILVHV